mgnify:CR=1 FL=1
MYGAEASIISGTRKAYKKILAEITKGRAVEEADLPDAPVRESKEVTRLIGVRVEAKSKRDKVKDEIDALTQQQKASSDPEAQKDFQVRIDVLEKEWTKFEKEFERMEGRITKARREEKEGRKQLERIRDVLDTLEPESGSMDKDAILKGQGKVDDMRAFLNKIVIDAPSLDVSDVQAALDAADRSWDSVTPEEPALPEAHTAEFTKYWTEKLNAVELEKVGKIPDVPGFSREKAEALWTEDEKAAAAKDPNLNTANQYDLWLKKIWVREEAKVPEPAQEEKTEEPAQEDTADEILDRQTWCYRA